MKKLMMLIAMVIFAGQAGAQTTDFLQHKEFQAEKKKIYDGMNNTRKQLTEVKKEETKIANSIDSIKLSMAMNAVQLSSDSDSLAKTNSRVSALQAQFDNQRSPSRGFLILLFVILLLLFLILLIVILQFKKRADMKHQSIVDLDKKTNERIDMEVKNLQNDILSNREALQALSADLGHQITSGYNSMAALYTQLEKQMREDHAGIEIKLSAFSPEINKLREEQAISIKRLEEKLHTLKHEADLLNQGLTVRAAKLEEEFKLSLGKK